MDTLDYSSISEHKCNHCDKDLMEEEMCILDDMATSGCQGMLSKDQELAVFYLAGYVASKHLELSSASPPKPHHASSYLQAINRVKLTHPSDDLLNLVLLGFYFFVRVNFNHCRKRLVKILSTFPEKFSLDINVSCQALSRLANIFFKRYCIKESRKSEDNTDHSQRKIMKLSSLSASQL